MKNYSDSEFFNCPLRGVTTVLNTVFGNKYENSNIPEYILKAAADRGTAVHKYIETWLSWYKMENRVASEEPHLPLEYAIYETVWKDWLSNRIDWRIYPAYTEQRIINKQLGVKGIIDCIAVVGKDVCLIDWKTSSNLDEWITECQLQLYYMMLLKGSKEEKALAKSITELRCLSLTKAGYRWFKFEINKKLGNSILELWNYHFRGIAELERAKQEQQKLASKHSIILQ